MFANSLSSCSRYNAILYLNYHEVFTIHDSPLCFEISEDNLHPRTVSQIHAPTVTGEL